MKYFLPAIFLFMAQYCSAQLAPLTVEKIMRDPKWMGVAPSNYRWSQDSKTLYFDWNPENKDKTALYEVSQKTEKIAKAKETENEIADAEPYSLNTSGTFGLLEKKGDIYLKEIKHNKITRLTNTLERESNPVFLINGDVVFEKDKNLFEVNTKTAEIKQLSNFINEDKPVKKDKELSQQDQWLKKEQTDLFDVIKKKNAEEAKAAKEKAKSDLRKPLHEIYTNKKYLSDITISPNGKYITYKLTTFAGGNRNTIVPNYVTKSGYTEDISGRTKVGEQLSTSQSYIFDIGRDSVYAMQTASITGIKDLPDYLKDYPKALDSLKKKNADRSVNISSVMWNDNATTAVVVATSSDNKDRWILKLNIETGKFSTIDRQRDEAWIGGPGIDGYDEGNVGWIDNARFYYQSEATGYSHLYVANVATGDKKQLTSGNWEVQTLQLSKDKKDFYFTANKAHPGITNFFKIRSNGGDIVQLTNLDGLNRITLSPDEKTLAINHSYMNTPWELYLQPNNPTAKAKKITQSTSVEFNSYSWRKPNMITFKNRYGKAVYARVYKPTVADKSHPAVVFVHGAGYLQNVHFGWSDYFREYMFNNLLADNGYTVIDIDYTGSAGYGRDFRTGIYRHMGGKDLTDQVDGVKYLVENYGVNPAHVGLYGGSYGGFITLMAMFKENTTFTSGAALRSVTDWANYNHGYTSNILNEPYNDPIAYRRSSPIYFADQLKGNLLMAHGMVDVNVHFQDIVHLTQRFIELGKNNWNLAVYPVESHGFVQPSSWTDEYKRMFKLFETTLKIKTTH
ncbi:dipeptidyl aminopeptidase/acylaminoacyl peptidase [Pedobacter sp. UYP30]|uniref:S9 family peptidase n=1 Tax=Pedobacter sp. UYP30 TaxID=1756400 RepID=UPI0033917B98